MRKIFVIAFIAAAALAALATVAVIVIPLVMAQGEAVPVAPETTFGWVVLAWVIYAIAGLVASITNPTEHFDPKKFAGSFLTAILTGFIAMALKIEPNTVSTQFGPVLNMVVAGILNAGPGLTLIYLFNKGYAIVMNTKAKIETARALSTPGPPKP
jgi:hypothetical protein